MNFILVTNDPDREKFHDQQEFSSIVNTRTFLLDCKNSYHSWIGVMDEFKKDVARMKIIYNSKIYNDPKELFYALNQHKMLICLCTQSTFGYMMEKLRLKYGIMEKNIHVTTNYKNPPMININYLHNEYRVFVHKRFTVLNADTEEIMMYIDANIDLVFNDIPCTNINDWFLKQVFDYGVLSWKLEFCISSYKMDYIYPFRCTNPSELRS